MSAASSEQHILKQRRSKSLFTNDLKQLTRNYLSFVKQGHMTFVSPPMNHSTTSDHTQSEKTSTMKKSTFNFLIDTLYEEVMQHPHKEELLTLINAQIEDDAILN